MLSLREVLKELFLELFIDSGFLQLIIGGALIWLTIWLLLGAVEQHSTIQLEPAHTLRYLSKG